MGQGLFKSPAISFIARFWAAVSRKGRISRIARRTGSSSR